MYDMICKDSVVAVRPNVESLSDYFLFHVMSDGVFTLTENTLDSGHHYQMGTKVVEGCYYNYIKSNRKGCSYKQCRSRTIIPVGCVLYVGIDLTKEGDTFILEQQDHEDIMCSIAV